MNKRVFTYKKSGVDINAAEKFVKFITAISSKKRGKKKLNNIGGFGSISNIPNNIKDPKIVELKEIIKDVKAKSNQYNYDWIGIMSGSGFTHEVLDYVKGFHEQGIGLGLIDAVTKQLIVNKETDEGAHLNQMFLSECIS